MRPEKIDRSRYKELTRINIHDPEALRYCNIPEVVRGNLKIFSSLGTDFYDNLRRPVISPLTGKRVMPLKHFGIDSDPWMHSILFREDSRFFIFICKGLTRHSVLGAILIPGAKVILENRDSWYYSCVFKKRIDRNLLRITSYFNSFLAHEAAAARGPGGRELVAAVGNGRVGDFLMQLNWLVSLLEREDAGEFSLSKILVNARSDFFDLSEFFKGRGEMVQRLSSLGHVEQYVRGTDHTLVSEAISFSHTAHLSKLKMKFTEFIERSRGEFRESAVPPDFDECALKIWVSFELEKRVWLEQFEALGKVIIALGRKCLRAGESVALVFAGMTGIESGDSPWYVQHLIALERQLINEFSARLRCRHRIFNLAGQTLRVKTLFASEVDFVVAPLGSASLLPSLIFDKPGVVYGNSSADMRAFAGDNTIILDKEMVTDLQELKGAVDWGTRQCVSYSIAPQAVVKVIEQHFTFGRCPETGRPVAERISSAASPA